MEKQFLNLPSTQVTYRVFLRDMFPGWIAGMFFVYGAFPSVFKDTDKTGLITVVLLALLWSPVVGLLTNTIGYIFLEWILDSKFVQSLFQFFFRKSVKMKESLGLRIIELSFEKESEEEKKKQAFDTLQSRAHFLIRAVGWSDKDELVERVHGVLQSARTLSFLCILGSFLFGGQKVDWYSVSMSARVLLLSLSAVFLVLSCFLTQYAKVVDIRLLYELLLLGIVKPSVIRGEIISDQ